MLLKRRSLLSAMSLLVPIRIAAAQVKIPETRLDILRSDVSTHRVEARKVELPNGRTFRLFSAVPRRPAPQAGYPIVYMLDGNAAFDLLTPELLASVPDLVVIGVGYETSLRFDVNQRSLDYTPPVGNAGPVADPDRPERLIGGADRFLDMLTGDLRLEAERSLRIDGRGRYLWGHSYGGLFALYTLFTAPRRFAGYAAISPSVWWGKDLLRPLEDNATWPSDRSIPLLVALGDKEQRSNDKNPPPDGPAPDTMALLERLKRQSVLEIETHVLEGHGHGATLGASLPLVFDWIKRTRVI